MSTARYFKMSTSYHVQVRKALVEHGYDLCAREYEQARQPQADSTLFQLIQLLPARSLVLDIGCGPGIPITRALAHRFTVTGIDISASQIRRARLNVPRATFIHADIMDLNFSPCSYDAIVSYYALFHLAKEEQSELLQRLRMWLRPGGYLFLSLTYTADPPSIEDGFFGVRMFWESYNLEDYVTTLKSMGFSLLQLTEIGSGYRDESNLPKERHPLMLAQLDSRRFGHTE